MKSNNPWRIRLAQILLGAAFLLALVIVCGTHAGNEPIHLTTDWSHRHVVFSAPQNLGQHVRLLSDPRYVQQLVRRNAGNGGDGDDLRWRRAPETPELLNGDWSMNMGPGATLGAGNYPAKYSFNAGTANCATAAQPDFVVYNTSLAGIATAIDASQTGTFSGTGATNGQTAAITNSNLPVPNSLVIYANTGTLTTASGTITVGSRPNPATSLTLGSVIYTFSDAPLGAGTTEVLRSSTTAEIAQNLQAAIDDNPSECFAAGCFASGITAPNPVVAHPAARTTNVITVTAPIDGAAGDFTLTEQTNGKITVGGGLGTNGAGANDGLNFLVVAGNTTTTAANMAAAIARSGASIGVTATSAGAVVTVTATTGGTAGDNITLAETVNNFTWAGGTLAGGANKQADILAFDNLYSGCATGTVPSTYWAYDTGGTVVTSPALSADGTQVAFIQTVGAEAQLVLLKWAASGSATYSNPVTLTSQSSAANYRTCMAPCMYTITFGNGAADTGSSPFYDYTAGSDALYVGDDTGYLHQFTNVFNGSPAEAGSPWPLLTATAPLTSPVYDENTGYVYVASSYTAANNGGRIHADCATATCGTIGTIVASGIIGPDTGSGNCRGTSNSGGGVALHLDGLILDPTNSTIYAFIGNDGNGLSAVIQFSSGFASQDCGNEVTLGTGSTTGVPVYAGDFDNFYYSGSAGHMYVCGNAGGDPTLYQITAPANGILSAGAATAGPVLTTAATTCGPVVEFYNPNAGPATDWIFTSVQASGKTTSPISCPTNTGCIMSFNVTSGAAITAATATVGHTAVAGGASGVTVDNTVATGTLAGASQVYFTPLADQACTTSGGTGGCAIQASQSGLD